MRALAVLACLLAPACSAPGPVASSGQGAAGARAAGPVEAAEGAPDRAAAGPTQDGGELSLPPDWLEVSPRTFEERVDAYAAAGASLRFGHGARVALTEALAQPGVAATRAAVLLAHAAAAGDDEAREALVARLERRAHAPSRSEAAGDVVAAAALAAHAADSPRLARRLAALGAGDAPHPELDVRVECARAALAGGRDEVAPFLLAVLRAETPDQRLAPPDWTRTTNLYWAKARAADALAARAGVPSELRPDGSWAHQTACADALEAALRAAGAL